MQPIERVGGWRIVPCAHARAAAFLFGSLLALLPLGAQAAPSPVEVSGGWVRATVPGQLGTGAFMTLTSHPSLRLVVRGLGSDDHRAHRAP